MSRITSVQSASSPDLSDLLLCVSLCVRARLRKPEGRPASVFGSCSLTCFAMFRITSVQSASSPDLSALLLCVSHCVCARPRQPTGRPASVLGSCLVPLVHLLTETALCLCYASPTSVPPCVCAWLLSRSGCPSPKPHCLASGRAALHLTLAPPPSGPPCVCWPRSRAGWPSPEPTCLAPGRPLRLGADIEGSKSNGAMKTLGCQKPAHPCGPVRIGRVREGTAKRFLIPPLQLPAVPLLSLW